MKKKKKHITENEAEDIKEQDISEESKKDKTSDIEQKEEDSVEIRYRKLEQEKSEAVDKYFRLLAEFENYRRRNDKERVNWIRNANENLSLKICDILDDFERALAIETEEGHLDQFIKGVKSIYQKLEKVLNSEGVQKIVALGEDFNPMYHEAISYIPSEEKTDTILSVIQNGYIMNNKVIRAAKVAVSSGGFEQKEDRQEERKENNEEKKEEENK